MQHHGQGNDGLKGRIAAGVSIGHPGNVIESAITAGRYLIEGWAPVAGLRAEYIASRDELFRCGHEHKVNQLLNLRAAKIRRPLLDQAMDDVALTMSGRDRVILQQLANIPQEKLWETEVPNTVATVGKNDLLDKYLAGSGYTAAFFLGLISSVGYSAISAADTMASHAGWTEAGPTNAPNYSQSTRPAPSWAAASAGSKATASAVAFSITATGTVKGAFLTTVSTKDGTTGILFSAGLFTGGDKAVGNGDTINATYTLSV